MLGAIGASLGTALGSGLGSIGLDAILGRKDTSVGDARAMVDHGARVDRIKDQWKMHDIQAWYGDYLGATPQEILGSPAAGGAPSSAATSTLGNAAATAGVARQQRDMQLRENALDRAVQVRAQDTQLKVAETQAAAQLEAAGISGAFGLQGAQTSAAAIVQCADQ